MHLFITTYMPPLMALINSPNFIYNYSKNKRIYLPVPTVSGHKELALFCGYSYEAFRTQLSRSKSKKDVLIEDSDGYRRVLLAEQAINISEYYQQSNLYKDYTLVLFSFLTGENKRRYHLKETLKNLKFTMINPNAYLAWGIDCEALNTLLIKEDFDQNTQVFSSIKELPETSINCLIESCDLVKWEKETNNFIELFNDYLNKYPSGNQERLFALLAASVALYTHLIIPSPNLPVELFPSSERIQKMDLKLFAIFDSEWGELSKQYFKWFNM